MTAERKKEHGVNERGSAADALVDRLAAQDVIVRYARCISASEEKQPR